MSSIQKSDGMQNKLLPLLVLFFLFTQLPAQDKSWELGLALGTSAIGGDMIDDNFVLFDQASVGFGAFARRRLGQNFSTRLNLNYGRLKSDDSKRTDEEAKLRNFSSSTSLFDISLQFEIDILGHNRFREGKFHRLLSPYVFGGVGLAFFSPEPDFKGSSLPGVREDQAAVIDERQLSYPFGAGLRLDVSPNLAIALEFAPRAIATDYLDGVSIAANPDKDDTYVFTTFQLVQRLGNFDKDRDGIADQFDACPEQAGSEATMGCPDRDYDGIADHLDQCPEIEGKAALSGCPDNDNDGISNLEDRCPNRPGSKATNGCPDSDGDGIADTEDTCPELAGLAINQGCPDTDKDGIADREDRCPNLAGVASAFGCPDNDGDGINNAEDKCPNLPGLSAANGCPDRDADGVADAEDKCPEIAGLKAYAGCPEANTKSGQEYDLAGRGIVNLLFDSDQELLRIASNDILDKVILFLKEYPEVNLTIAGHADSR